MLGAGGGLLSGGLLAWGGWFFSRKRRAKAIKIALFYEIFRHHIFEASPQENGDPNFMIVGFARAVYDAYLDEIPDLLPQKLVGDISMYYADVTAGAAQLERIDAGGSEVREAALELIRVQSLKLSVSVNKDEVALAEQAAAQAAHRMLDRMSQTRHLLATAMWQRERLLRELQREFKHDPAKQLVNVLPKYRAWFDREAKERGLTPIEGDEDD